MIIFGLTAKHKTIGTGEFYCPYCQAKRQYEHKKAKRYFSLYFIPLIPLDDMGEVIECQTCHRAFGLEVLNQQPPKRKRSLADMLNSVKQLLDEGMPIEYLVRDLTAAGIERDVALATVQAQVGEARKICKRCGLTYTSTITTCTECQQALDDYVR